MYFTIVKTHTKNPMLGISGWNSENKDKEHILEWTDYSKTVLEDNKISQNIERKYLQI